MDFLHHRGQYILSFHFREHRAGSILHLGYPFRDYRARSTPRVCLNYPGRVTGLFQVIVEKLRFLIGSSRGLGKIRYRGTIRHLCFKTVYIPFFQQSLAPVFNIIDLRRYLHARSRLYIRQISLIIRRERMIRVSITIQKYTSLITIIILQKFLVHVILVGLHLWQHLFVI